MEIITEFCSIHFIVRLICKQIGKYVKLDTHTLLLLTFLLSLLVITWFKIEQYQSDSKLFLNLLHIFYLSFNIQVINILFRDYKDYQSFAFDNLKGGNYIIYWLSEIDKNLWKIGLLSILFKNLFEQYKLFKY